MSNSFNISLFTANGKMTKTFGLEDGKLVKQRPGLIAEGTYKVRETTLAKLAPGLKSLNRQQALGLGTPGQKKGRIVTKKEHDQLGSPDDPIPRDKNHFPFRKQPTAMLFDLDGVEKSAAQILSILGEIVPGLAKAEKLIVHSSSSGLCLGEKLIKDSTSAHVYCVVKDGTDIPRFMVVLFKQLWLKGHAHIKIGAAGQMLKRSIIDPTVGCPERIIYEAPPILNDGIIQNRPDPLYISGSMLDTSLTLDMTKNEEQKYQHIVTEVMNKVKPEADKVIAKYDRKQAQRLIKKGMPEDEACEAVKARRNGILMLNDIIYLNRNKIVKVKDIDEQHNGQTCCDPLEPSYNNWHNTVAKIFMNDDGSVVVNSNAHGGGVYRVEVQQQNKAAKPDSPLPLVKKNEESDPFPFAALGPTMAAACEAIQEGIQAPDAIIAQSVLGAANLAVQGQRDIIIDGRISPLSVNLLSIAGTGERKSAVDNVALAKHREIEQVNISRLASKQASYELIKSAYEHDKQALIKTSKKSLKEKQTGLEQLQKQAPVRPLDQTSLVADFTFEGLFKLFQEGIPCKGLFADEGGQVTGGHGMRREAKLSTATGLSKLWDGARVDRIRVLDGCSHLYGRRLAVHLMMQDDVGLGFYTDNVLKDQGLISRFLTAWPTSTVGKRKYNPVNVKDTAQMVTFYQKVSGAMHVKLKSREDSNDQELDPQKLPLSPEAKCMWVELYNSIEFESAHKGMLTPIRGFANKAAEHAARIAGTIQMFEHPGSAEIKADAMECGIAAIEWYLTEALRITGTFTPDTYLLRAQEALHWINDNALKVVTLPDIYQFSPVRSASQARKVVGILKTHNHLLEPELGKDEKKEAIETRTGGMSKEWWTVHPDSKASLNHD